MMPIYGWNQKNMAPSISIARAKPDLVTTTVLAPDVVTALFDLLFNALSESLLVADVEDDALSLALDDVDTVALEVFALWAAINSSSSNSCGSLSSKHSAAVEKL